MARFIARRLLETLLVLFAISVIVFLIFNVIPNSDPAQRMAGKLATPELVQSITEEWGFDDSLPRQYLTMMEKMLSGDLVSYTSTLDVDEQIVEGIPETLSLTFGAAALWLLMGIALGYISAVKAGGRLDKLLTGITVAAIATPVLWLGPVLIYLLTFKLELFPSGGYVPLTEDPIDWVYHLILPWTTLAVLYMGFYSRVLRSSMLEVMQEDHVRTARAKGLGERRVMSRHVLRNSLIPIVTIFGLDVGAVIGGSAIVAEVVFDIPGVGLYAYEAILNSDLPPIMAITLFGAFFVVLFNTLVDIAYAYLDPRVKLGASAQ